MNALTPASVLVYSDGTEIGTETNPVRVDPTGTTTQPVSTVQLVQVSSGNSTIVNLASGGVFPGTPVSLLDVAGIRVIAASDQKLQISVLQGGDATNWDIGDTFVVDKHIEGVAALYSDSRVVQAVGSFFCVQVRNIGGAPTTYCRVQSLLCPIVEPLPRIVGQNSMASSLSVVFATDQPPFTVAIQTTNESITTNRLLDEMHHELGRIRHLLELLTDEQVRKEDIDYEHD